MLKLEVTGVLLNFIWEATVEHEGLRKSNYSVRPDFAISTNF